MANSGTPAALQPLPLPAVTIDDVFWAHRRATVRTKTLPQQESQLRADGHFQALTLQWKPGDADEPHIFWESDLAKWIEAASFTLATHPDAELDAAVDEAIGLLGRAQQPDGYLNVYFTIVRPGQRLTDLRDGHELYCLGHLIEAAVAHYHGTGKTALLDVVRRYVDLVDDTFAPGGPLAGGYDGHQEIELALVKLARATGERKYLDLALRFIDARGTEPFYFDEEEKRRPGPGYFDEVFRERETHPQRFREYNQSHTPVREQDEIVGHSVRAMYMLAAMADLAAEYGDESLLRACERLWQSVTATKMYITGGLGSDHTIEGFGSRFELPDASGYAETCAAIGLVMWAQRMVNLTRDGQYADVMERALYNAVLSGSSLDGTCYFYSNPLASGGEIHRHEWFGVACCPPNLARLLSSLQAYTYAENEDEFAIHLYMAGTAHTRAGGGAAITVDSLFPIEGLVTITVEPEQRGPGHHGSGYRGREWTLALRMPAWSKQVGLKINGELMDSRVVTERGYVRLTRAWKSGDTVEIALDLTPHRVWTDPRVTAVSGKAALQRGPAIYCFEGVDHNYPTQTLLLPRDAELRTEPDSLSGLPAILAHGAAETRPSTSGLYTVEAPERVSERLRAIPYYAWANRGDSTMNVFIREA